MASKVCECVCPICHEPGADVKVDTNGRHYVNCDECGCLIRSTGRKGRKILADLANAVEVKNSLPDPEPQKTKGEGGEPDPAPPSPPKAAAKPAPKKLSFFGLQP